MVEIGVPADKLVVMPNGVNPEHMRPASGEQELRKALGLERKVVVGFVGWFKAWHGLGFLLKSFHDSGLGNRGIALLLVGDGPALPDLLADAEKFGLKDAVVFTGAVPHAEIPRYLALIDIAVQPAANEYCCPMKILEYLALGKPLIGPRQENIQELVREGVDAMLFAPGEEAGMIRALEGIALDAERRAGMSVAAARAIEERGFLWTRNAQRVIELAAGKLG
jgi:glycosyltransferase involved in cell wall biosynthesis